MGTYVVKVPGISCDHCARAITGEVVTLPGVHEVTVDVTSKRVTVVGEVPVEAVHAAIEDAGYAPA
jgi:copper chaperone